MLLITGAAAGGGAAKEGRKEGRKEERKKGWMTQSKRTSKTESLSFVWIKI